MATRNALQEITALPASKVPRRVSTRDAQNRRHGRHHLQAKQAQKIGIFVLLAISMFCAADALAGSASRFDETTQTCRKFDKYDALMTEGFLLFKEHCKSCHFRGNDHNAPFIFSESYTPKAWNRIFYERYPKCAKDGTWDVIPPQNLMKINDYLFRFGATTADRESASC